MMKKLLTFSELHTRSLIIERLNAILSERLNEYRDYEEDEDYSLDDSDRWLHNYTHKEQKWGATEDIVADLLDKYANDEELTIYRGMNFDTEEEFNEFMKTIEEGKRTSTKGISSWSPSRHTAWTFAITRPTYFLNMELMRAEDKKSKEREYMIGYRGVILKTTIKPGQGIDVRKSNHGAESEVILPKGKYDIEIEEVKPFKDMIKEQDPNKVVMGLTQEDIDKDSFNAQFFKYMVFHATNFDDGSREHLFKMFVPKQKPKVELRKTRDYGYRNDKKRTQIGIELDGMPWQLFMYDKVLGDKYKPKLKKISNEILKELTKALAKDPDFEQTRIESGLGFLMTKMREYADPSVVKKYQDTVRGRLGAEYRKYSNDDVATPDKVREINNIKDPDKKRQAIDDYAKELERILQNIAQIA